MRRPTEIRLRRTFSDVLATVLATAAGAAVLGGCGGSTSTVDGTSGGGGSSSGTPGFTYATLCGEAPTSLLTSIHASPELDGIANRSETAYARTTSPYGPDKLAPNPETAGDGWKGTTGESVGNLCSKASDRAACLAKVQNYRMLPPTREACLALYNAIGGYEPFDCAASYIIYTRGDEIGVARTNDEKKALMGTFDTLGEALWAASLPGYGPSCEVRGGRDGQTVIPNSEYRKTADGGWDLRLTTNACGQEIFAVTVHVDYAGNTTVTSKESLGDGGGCPVAGRRPAGFQEGAHVASDRPIGEHFATMATLEAASVTAFRRLRRQLAAYGAPRALLARIRKAAKDEVRHARATGALARKYGVTPKAPRLAPSEASPSLLAIALENAREGCVRETYGALVAHLQIERAADADVRSVMRAIADEETEHAALSWDIASWIETQLGEGERLELAAERRAAFATLARDLAAPVDARVRHASGVPAAADALALLEGLAPLMLAA